MNEKLLQSWIEKFIKSGTDSDSRDLDFFVENLPETPEEMYGLGIEYMNAIVQRVDCLKYKVCLIFSLENENGYLQIECPKDRVDFISQIDVFFPPNLALYSRSMDTSYIQSEEYKKDIEYLDLNKTFQAYYRSWRSQESEDFGRAVYIECYPEEFLTCHING